jgi:AraC family transcriptional activator of pobA
MEGKHLLKYSKMSVQEISYYLNFPNQSFFAQYFKRQTGLTPSDYRTQL